VGLLEVQDLGQVQTVIQMKTIRTLVGKTRNFNTTFNFLNVKLLKRHASRKERNQGRIERRKKVSTNQRKSTRAKRREEITRLERKGKIA
jgi:hypothetical protein